MTPTGTPIRALVRGENRHEKREPRVAERYPERLHDAIRAGIEQHLGAAASVTPTTLDEPEHGLTEQVLADHAIIRTEMFGPASVVSGCRSRDKFSELASLLEGLLTTSVQADDDDPNELVAVLQRRSARILWNGWPTGVTISYAQQHGGPYPATTPPGSTSVGTAAIGRFVRPMAHQSFPTARLPPELRDANPWAIERRINGGPTSSERIST